MRSSQVKTLVEGTEGRYLGIFRKSILFESAMRKQTSIRQSIA